MDSEHPIEGLMVTAMNSIQDMIDVNTIIGEPIETSNNIIIIPISKVTVGYVVGGGEYADLSSRRVANNYPMAGGSSGGMSLTPVGFLVLTADGEVKFVNVENKSLYQTMVNLFNSLISKMEKDENDIKIVREEKDEKQS